MVVVVAGALGEVVGCLACSARVASIIALTIGPAILAPVNVVACSGTTTAIATVGLLAGANPIIQSTVFWAAFPTWAVPVFTATSSWGGKPTPAAVPPGVVTTPCMSFFTDWADAGELAVL